VLPSDLVDVLVCPKSKQPLVYFPRGEADQREADGFLLCPASRLRFPIHEGVPVMLVEEATEVADPEVVALIARARELGLPVPPVAARAT
jgi:uncharacterized protein